MAIVDKIKLDIEELESWYRKTHYTLSDYQAEIVVNKIDKINLKLAKYAKKYGEDFYNKNMSKSILRFDELCQLLKK